MRAPAAGLASFPALPDDVRLVDLAWNAIAELPDRVAGLASFPGRFWAAGFALFLR